MSLPARIGSLTLLAVVALLAPAAARAELEWSDAVLNGVDGEFGIQRATDVAVSPDGLFVYVTGILDDSIAIFARDAVSGALVYSDRVVWDGATPVPGTIPDLDQPIALSLSADGKNLYSVAGPTVASVITCFARDPESGALAHIQSLADNSGPNLYNLARPQDVLVSRDGTTVYVTSFEDRAITALTRDPGTGLLAGLQVVRDDLDGVDGLEGLQEVAESPDGAFLYAASASRPVTGPGVGGVATFARALDGTLTFLEVEQQGVGDVDGLWAPRDVAVSPDGANVYVAAGGRPGDDPPQLGAIATFTREVDGTLTFRDSIPESAFGRGEPRGVAVSPDGSEVYVTAFGVLSGPTGLTPGKLSVFARDAASGALTLAQRFDDNVGGVEGLAGALGVAVSPDGWNVYVAASQDPASNPLRGAVAVFSQVPEPGTAAAGGAAVAALAALLQRASSHSRGRRNSS